MRVNRGECKRLIVMMPPRHGKSNLAVIKFVPFYLGGHPSARVIIAAHTATLAMRHSLHARNDFAAFAPEVFALSVNPDVSAMYQWDVKDAHRTEGEPPGGVLAAGIGGPITGQGADLAVIDDPVKDREQADSDIQRENIWDWYTSVLRTRLHPNATIILILTRWHEDDLAGRLLRVAGEDAAADQWEVIKLPALAEVNDPLGRALDEPLWPERYDNDALLQTKASVGPYVWAALYQQRPAPAEGGLLKRSWWKRYADLPGGITEWLQSWDMAFKETKTSDFVVGQVWARKGADCYLVDQVRRRMDFPATLEAVKALSARYPKALTKLVEDAANGPAVIAALRHEVAGLVAVKPQGGKEARASAISGMVEAGNVHLPETAWAEEFIAEATAFPNGPNDDQVDAASQALLRFARQRGVAMPGQIEQIKRASPWRG